ncbi:hypothetical protein ACFUTX_16035 [Microbacterium sp. NPDC057407]|uniref:hypothetical protein n=1 Tax=Microbacterium sp. NPDC057407 TaxID=3346120 RepID=UPI003671301F
MAIVAASAVGFSIGDAVDAHRSTAPPKIVTSVVNKSVINRYWTNMGQMIGSCKVGTKGSTCSISTGKTATRSVSLAYGMTRGAVTASLGIDAATSVSVGTSCSSPPLPAGRIYRAYPIGEKWQYKIQKITYVGIGLSKTQKTGWLTAFNPSRTHIYCV